jgi:hypothetical protein
MAIQYLTLIGPPAIATFLSGWLRDAKLPKWLDTIIAFLVVLITAFVWAILAGKLVGDLPADTVVIAAYVAALVAGPMAALHAFLVVSLPSPFSIIMDALRPFEVEEEPTPPATIASRIPRITLPTTPALVERSSLLTSDPTWRATVAAPPDTTPAQAVPATSTSTGSEHDTGPMPVVATQPTPEQGQAQPPSAP